MRITARGQVTIPIEIREKLGLVPGTEVDLAIEGSALRISRAQEPGESQGGRVVKLLEGSANIAMSTDEIMALTRKS